MKKVGCYYCLSIFPKKDILFYTKDGYAICPKCSVDSICEDEKLTYKKLKELSRKWFKIKN